MNSEEPKVMTDEQLLKMPPSIRADYVRRNENIKNGEVLCGRCGGTGNMYYTKYKKCDKCDGKGHE
jgi:uncharacterized OB-fold protein